MQRERLETFTPRHEGCRARLEDDGRHQTVPVCMGGTAIVGCNNADVCLEVASGSLTPLPNRVVVIHRDENNSQIVKHITTNPRGTFTVADVEAHQSKIKE